MAGFVQKLNGQCIMTFHTSISQATYICSDRRKYGENTKNQSKLKAQRMYNQVEITLKPVHSEKPIYSYAHHQIKKAIEKLPK